MAKTTVQIQGEVTEVYMVFLSEYTTGIVKHDYTSDIKRLRITFESQRACFEWAYELGYWRKDYKE